MATPSFDSHSRLQIFAPHPDDESLACGILLQHAVAAGAAINVVYLTDGENNPWPQRCLTRRWRLNASDRQKWAKLRRQEALASLKVLNVAPENVRFLGWPDQGLAHRLKAEPILTRARLRYLIMDFSATDVIGPDAADRHRDHSAVGRMLDQAFAAGGAVFEGMRRWTYVVHGLDGDFLEKAEAVPQTRDQAEAKERAVNCHGSQLLLSRRRFLGYARRPEFLRAVA